MKKILIKNTYSLNSFALNSINHEFLKIEFGNFIVEIVYCRMQDLGYSFSPVAR